MPEVKYKTITPEEAHVLLKRSKRKNVPTKKRKIDQYARAMIDKKWDCYNSQAVSLDTDGNIVNGHQRLMACVQANTPFRTLYITGVPPDTFRNEDSGRTRDAGHFFAVLGEEYYVELAAGARMLYLWERGLWHYGTAGISQVPMTNEDLQEELQRRPQLRAAAKQYAASKKLLRGRFPASLVVALHALTQGNPKHAAFWSELLDRVGGNKSSQVWQLNRRIDAAEARGTRLTGRTLQALLTKAWAGYTSGSDAKLMWTNAEKMPVPVTSLTPALLPPDADEEVITVSPVKRPKPLAGPPVLKIVPKPEKRKKGPKLRGGLAS